MDSKAYNYSISVLDCLLALKKTHKTEVILQRK